MSDQDSESVAAELNLTGLACPMNFVKTKLALDKIPVGALLCVRLDQGERLDSVTESVRAEGHEILSCSILEDGSALVTIRKV